jgi:hypothetical protein
MTPCLPEADQAWECVKQWAQVWVLAWAQAWAPAWDLVWDLVWEPAWVLAWAPDKALIMGALANQAWGRDPQ